MLSRHEETLELHWRSLIKERLSNDLKFTILSSKKVADIVICRDGNPPIAFFLEFKVNIISDPSKRMGITKGWQEEIIRGKPSYFDRYLRWILCNDNGGEKNYVFVSNDIIRENLRGGKLSAAVGKQINISPKIFNNEALLSENDLLNKLIAFLTIT